MVDSLLSAIPWLLLFIAGSGLTVAIVHYLICRNAAAGLQDRNMRA